MIIKKFKKPIKIIKQMFKKVINNNVNKQIIKQEYFLQAILKKRINLNVYILMNVNILMQKVQIKMLSVKCKKKFQKKTKKKKQLRLLLWKKKFLKIIIKILNNLKNIAKSFLKDVLIE